MLFSSMEKKDLHIRYWLISALSYAAFFALLFFLLQGRIADNFRTGGYEEEVKGYFSARESLKKATYDVAFWSTDGIVMTERETDRGFSDELHLKLEALLEGPGPEGLEKGLITYIPDGTELVGVTMKDGMCFVQLSKEILGTSNEDRVLAQIKNTLSAGNPGLRVAVMVDGEIIF